MYLGWNNKSLFYCLCRIVEFKNNFRSESNILIRQTNPFLSYFTILSFSISLLINILILLISKLSWSYVELFLIVLFHYSWSNTRICCYPAQYEGLLLDVATDCKLSLATQPRFESNPAIWRSCQWLGSRRWFSLCTLVSLSTSYWLVTNSPKYGWKKWR